MSKDEYRAEVIPPPSDEGGSVYDASGKSPQQIEEDIIGTRAQLGAILDALERKLAPRHLLERGMDMFKGGSDAGGLGERVRDHPWSLALIGIGLGWLAISATSGRGRLGAPGRDLRARVSTSPYPTASAGYAYAREKSGGAMAKATAAETGAAAFDSTAGQRAGEPFGEAQNRVTALLEEHPLAVGALGFLAGSLLALMLPRSDIEERLIGETGRQIRARAAELGREAAARVQQAAERTVDAAMGAVKKAVSEGR